MTAFGPPPSRPLPPQMRPGAGRNSTPPSCIDRSAGTMSSASESDASGFRVATYASGHRVPPPRTCGEEQSSLRSSSAPRLGLSESARLRPDWVHRQELHPAHYDALARLPVDDRPLRWTHDNCRTPASHLSGCSMARSRRSGAHLRTACGRRASAASPPVGHPAGRTRRAAPGGRAQEGAGAGLRDHVETVRAIIRRSPQAG